MKLYTAIYNSSGVGVIVKNFSPTFRKAETKTQIINLIGSEDELVDGNGERI